MLLPTSVARVLCLLQDDRFELRDMVQQRGGPQEPSHSLNHAGVLLTFTATDRLTVLPATSARCSDIGRAWGP